MVGAQQQKRWFTGRGRNSFTCRTLLCGHASLTPNPLNAYLVCRWRDKTVLSAEHHRCQPGKNEKCREECSSRLYSYTHMQLFSVLVRKVTSCRLAISSAAACCMLCSSSSTAYILHQSCKKGPAQEARRRRFVTNRKLRVAAATSQRRGARVVQISRHARTNIHTWSSSFMRS